MLLPPPSLCLTYCRATVLNSADALSLIALNNQNSMVLLCLVCIPEDAFEAIHKNIYLDHLICKVTL